MTTTRRQISWIFTAALPWMCGCAPGGVGGAGTPSAGDIGAPSVEDGTGDVGLDNDEDGQTLTPDATADTGSDEDGSASNGTMDTVLMGEFDPETGLDLASNDLSVHFPAAALPNVTTLTVNPSPPSSVPGGLPGGVSFAGATFEPAALELALSAEVRVNLATATAASVLPVLTFDSQRKRWVSTGSVATVDRGGLAAVFEIDVLGIVGVPDGVTAPPGEHTIGSLLTVTNQGSFSSNVIEASDASLIYTSAVGGSLNVSVMAQTADAQGQITTQTLSLSAVSLTQVENTIVAEVGGSDSFYSTGGFRDENEPVVGVMMMGFDGTTVTVTVYLATPERVIAGTLDGPAS